MPNFLVFAVASCAMLSMVVGLPTPQHRFSLPSHFSFRTVHVPSQPFVKPGRLIAPAQPKISHIPVMVSVPQDFVGDSVVVSSADLKNLPIDAAMMQADKSVRVETPVELSTPVEEIATPEVVEPVQEVVVEEAPVESLALADDSFVLTASEPNIAETVDVVVSEPAAVEPEVIDTPIEEEPVIPEEIIPVVQVIRQPVTTTTISPLETDTFHAYNNFLNTWLQLASVNLNRPDLLRFVNHIPAPQQATIPQEVVEPAPLPKEEIVEIIPEIIVDPVPEVIVEQIPEVAVEEIPEVIVEPIVTEMEQTIVEEVMEPEVTDEVVQTKSMPEIVGETVITEEVMPLTEAIDPVVQEIVEPEPMSVADVADEVPITDTIIDITTETPALEITTEAALIEAEPAVVSAVEISAPQIQETVLPEITPEILSTNTIAKSLSSQPIAQNSLAGAPTLLQPIPRFTSRGRFSGYRYSFAHVPQRGSFFLHPVSG